MNTHTVGKDIILVVDDSPDTLNMVTSALESTGATVLVALGGAQALELVQNITPDVVLMDCVMPGLDGFETCRHLMEFPDLQHTPVIFMTGLAETDHIIKGFQCGGVDYVHLANARKTRNAQTALDTARRHIVAMAQDGSVQWATPTAQRLLETEDKDGIAWQDRLSKSAMAWLDHYKKGEHRAHQDLRLGQEGADTIIATFIGQSDQNEYLFRIIEVNEKKDQDRLIGHFNLTPREAEVLLWVAHGKANKDIGEILDISPRTINKHLQIIFDKMGAENRTSAATMAMRVLWDG
jgi:DNA-binding NarL/FixJ family response regulator